MPAAYRQGFVFVQNIFAGIVSETDSGYKFKYDKDYLSYENPLAVSLTLPCKTAGRICIYYKANRQIFVKIWNRVVCNGRFLPVVREID